MRRGVPGFLGCWQRAALWVAVATALSASANPSPDLTFFEFKIRPLLAEHCYSCHSAQAEKLKGGLRLDSRERLLQGGDLGPAIVPGDPEKSLLIKAVGYRDTDLQMPPKNQKLSARQIADLTQWIKLGAPWPDADKSAVLTAKTRPESNASDKSWWAFQPVVRPVPPAPNVRKKTIAPIDAFITRALSAKRLEPNPVATRRELVRRAYFDLIGLPPSPEAIAAFAKDSSPHAWPRLIDHLLSLPQYGERWGRHWLDVVRFAQSNGYERDGEKPEAWRYRDYVVKAFNEDKPYDQFVREQIAGDELDNVTFDSIIATGFQRLGVWDDEPDDKRMAEFDELDDVLSTTGTAFLGLTIGCARCHDHKFDPIPQTDYYRLLGFFRNIRLSETAKYTLDSPNYVPLEEPAKVKAWQTRHEAKLQALQNQASGEKVEAEKKKLTKQIEDAKAEKPPFQWALAVRERGSKPPPTHLLVRGNAGSPGVEVQPAFLTALGEAAPTLPSPTQDATSSGRRKVLADWIANSRNPLTARVMVNRIWHHHFGGGLVKTTSDFGRAGAPPTHPALLDWLAAELIESGWSIKKLHKTIMLSETYQRSSRAENAKANRIDPGNDLLWRQNLRRLEAEALRDTMLAISGQLNFKMGGRGFFPHLSGEVLAGQSRPGLDWDISTGEEQSRRSLYAYVRRTMAVPMLDALDYSNTTSPLSERTVTTVAPQSLLLLNDEFMQRQAAALAKRLKQRESEANGTASRRTLAPDTDALIRSGFQLAVGRQPTQREAHIARDFLQRQEKSFQALRTRVMFRPDVPTALSVEYMNKLQPAEFLLGPRTGWEFYRGEWAAPYEGIRTMERDRGPFALLKREPFMNGVVQAHLILHNACESAGLLIRARADGDKFVGYEVVFDPRPQRVSLRRHDGKIITLAEVPAAIPMIRPIPVRVEASSARFRVWLGDQAEPLLDVLDLAPIMVAGKIGIRAWGSAVSLDDLAVQTEDQPSFLIPNEGAAPAADRALEAFCLLLLNLNEVVYVD